jgi:hypothetical protein
MTMPAILLKIAGRIAAPALAFLVVGCAAVGPDFQKPEVDTAEAWLHAEDERVDSSRAKIRPWINSSSAPTTTT